MKYKSALTLRLDRNPDLEAAGSRSRVEFLPVALEFGASATWCPDSGSHLFQIVNQVRRIAAM